MDENKGDISFTHLGNAFQDISRSLDEDGYLHFKATPNFISKWKKLEQNLGSHLDFESFTMDLLTNERIKSLEVLSPRLGKGRRISYNFDNVPELKAFRDLVAREINDYLHTLHLGYGLVTENSHCDLIVSETNAQPQTPHFDAVEGRTTLNWLFNPMESYSLDAWPGSHSLRPLLSNATKYGVNIPDHVDAIPKIQIVMERFSFTVFLGDLLHRGPKNSYGVVENVNGKVEFVDKLHVRFFQESEAIKESQHSYTTVSFPDRSHNYLFT